MKKLTIILFTLLLTITIVKAQSRAEDEAAIQKTWARFGNSWKNSDFSDMKDYLTPDIPYANFVGWQTVVFCYSAFSRLFEPRSLRSNIAVWRAALIAVCAVVCSLAVLYGTEIYLFPVMNKLHITSIYRFIGITVILLAVVLRHWPKMKVAAGDLSAVTWLVPGWFHLFFFASLFICGFYTEQLWMTVASCVNLVIGITLHMWPLSLAKTKREKPIEHTQIVEIG